MKIDWDGLPKRIRQLTRLSDSVMAFAPSPDSRQIAYVTIGAGASLWVMNENGEGASRLSQSAPAAEDAAPAPGRGGFGGGGISSPQFSRDGRSLYFLEGDGIYSVSVPPAADGGSAAPAGGGGGCGAAAAAGNAPPTATGNRKRVNFNLRVEVDHRAEREQVFDEGWRIMKHRFYDPAMHGVNWNAQKDTYQSLLKNVSDNEELYNIMQEMIGELNASHTGVSAGARRGADASGPPRTRFPGFTVEADAASGYYKVKSIYSKGPADKDFVKLKIGDYLLALNGDDMKTTDSVWKYFTMNTANRWDFIVNSKPSREGAWTAEIDPISEMAQSNLAYDNWVENRKKMVDRIGSNDIGYLHIRAMDAPSLRKFELDLAENRFKKALIIDQRFNGGGGIDQELLRILQQKKYQSTRRRDSIEQDRPQQAFFGPMVVMQNERSASDAEMFPDGFRALGLGKVIGVPTYGGVIGTGSFTLLDGGAIRTPGSGVYNAKGINMENYGVPPDIYIDNPPEETAKGRDIQIEKAIEVLKADVAAGGKSKGPSEQRGAVP